MATKTSSSVKTTTNLQTGSTQSFKTSYKTKTPTNIGKGGLSQLGRAGAITITIISVSVGSAMFQYNVNDLTSITPNYNQTNTFIPIENPLETINYQQYGEDVIDNLMFFIEPLSAIGQTAFGFWDQVTRFLFNPNVVQDGGFIDTFGQERFTYLFNLHQQSSNELGKTARIYLVLTETEKEFLKDVNTNIFINAENIIFTSTVFYIFYLDPYNLFGGPKYFWTMPSVIDLITQKG